MNFLEAYHEYLYYRPDEQKGWTSYKFVDGLYTGFIRFYPDEGYTIHPSGDKVIIRYKNKLIPGFNNKKRMKLREAIDFIWDKTYNVKEFTGDISFEI